MAPIVAGAAGEARPLDAVGGVPTRTRRRRTRSHRSRVRASAIVCLCEPARSARTSEGGYRWFEDRGVARRSGRVCAPQLRRARLVDGPDAAEYDRSRTYLLGFSAGMMTAGALVLDDPHASPGGAAERRRRARYRQATAGRLAGLPVFTRMERRYDDPTRSRAPDATVLRERSGAELTERTYQRDHSIARREIADIAEWLSERQ